MSNESPKKSSRISLLLSAAIWMTILLRQYPGTHAWLTAKLAALLVYIGLGMVAFKRGLTRRARITAA